MTRWGIENSSPGAETVILRGPELDVEMHEKQIHPCPRIKSSLLNPNKLHLFGVFFVAEGSHANVSWLTAGYSAPPPPSVDLHADVSYDDYEHNEYDDEYLPASLHGGASSDMSCIGIRKRCLMDTRCSRHLADYRHYCRENKKQNECVTVER